VIEVYPDKAPKTVANFLQYVKDKHYDGTIFHRVIENFMVQGGGFDGKDTRKGDPRPVIHEGREALAKGGLKQHRHSRHGAHPTRTRPARSSSSM
jgi:peptidyl-prolyl cis-trans isomerase A (cyclophilin A)